MSDRAARSTAGWWGLALGALVLAVVLAACGGEGEQGSAGASADAGATTPDSLVTESSTSPTTAPAPRPSFDPGGALLRLGDLGGEWEREPPPENDFGQVCGEKLSTPRAAAAGAEYSDESVILPVLSNWVAVYAPGEAEAAMAEIRELLTACTGVTTPARTRFEPTPVSFPRLGDDSETLLLTAEPFDIMTSVYAVVVRVGNGVTYLLYSSDDPAGDGEIKRLARRASQKLAAAQA